MPRGTVIGIYDCHRDAEEAVRNLGAAEVPLENVSIIGWKLETREDVEGYCQPAAAAIDGAGKGAAFAAVMTVPIVFVMGMAGVVGLRWALLLGVLVLSGGAIGAVVSAVSTMLAPGHRGLKYKLQNKAGSYIVVLNGQLSSNTDLLAQMCWPPAIDVNRANPGLPGPWKT